MKAIDQRIEGPGGLLSLRVYVPDEPAFTGLVWAHGGGFVWGDLGIPEADWVARSLAAHGICVVSVDYRLVSEGGFDDDSRAVRAPLPAFEVAAAYEWACTSDLIEGTWAIGGASAGGNLAAGATIHLLRTHSHTPSRVVLAYPTLHANQPPVSTEIQRTLAALPAAERFVDQRVRRMYDVYLAGSSPTDVSVPGIASLDTLKAFPPSLIINSEADALRASGEAFASSLRRAGRPVECVTEPGSTHGHLNRPDDVAAPRSIGRMVEFLGA